MNHKHSQLTELVASKKLTVATKPPDNPVTIPESGHFSATFITHDYPGKTPMLWNALYREHHLPHQSLMLVGDEADVSDILAAAKHDDRYVGGGLGVGFKDEAFVHVDELDPLAEAIGSINVIAKTAAGQLRGYNTDGIGYRKGLSDLLTKQNRTLADLKVLILGAGGTANAIAMALAEAGSVIMIANRTFSKAAELADRVNQFRGHPVAHAHTEEQVASLARSVDVIINVSTKGATGKFEQFAAFAPAIPDKRGDNLVQSRNLVKELPKHTVVSDIILSESDTPTIKLAKKFGLVTQDGLPMVINQAVEAVFIVHGVELAEKKMTRAQVQALFESLF